MPIRILVVDDSVVIRKLLTATLGEVAGLEVVATAGLGKIALAKIEQDPPDIVILDVEMPEMDGIETLKRIRKIAPRLPVIMFSTQTERGASATIEALTCGASDYVTKPSNVGNVLLAMARVREEMVPKIHALTARLATPAPAPRTTAAIARLAAPQPLPQAPRPAVGPAALTAPQPQALRPAAGMAAPRAARVTGAMAPVAPARPARTTDVLATQPPRPTVATLPTMPISRSGPVIEPLVRAATDAIRLRRPAGPRPPIEIVAIGASTGGPNALAVLLTQLPADFPVPIVIVQHMLATFTRHFAERLASQCQIKIVEATAGDLLRPGQAYVARGDYHLLVERRAGRVCVATNQDQVENFCRPAVDVLFRSVAVSYGATALAVVLTGMGHDGLAGCGAIRDAGGDIIVQDEASSVVWGMPGFVARAGLASEVMPLDQLGSEVRRRVALGGSRAAEARS